MDSLYLVNPLSIPQTLQIDYEISVIPLARWTLFMFGLQGATGSLFISLTCIWKNTYADPGEATESCSVRFA